MSHTNILGATKVNVGTANPADQGNALTLTVVPFYKAACADTVATAIGTVTVPNVGTSALIRANIINVFDGASHLQESARATVVMIVVVRQAGANAVAAIIPFEFSATNAVTNVNQLVMGTIATTAAGATLTTAVTLQAIQGAVGVTNTFTILVAATGSAAYTTLCAGWVELFNTGVGGVTFASAT